MSDVSNSESTVSFIEPATVPCIRHVPGLGVCNYSNRQELPWRKQSSVWQTKLEWPHVPSPWQQADRSTSTMTGNRQQCLSITDVSIRECESTQWQFVAM
jgi:hypothetical protein